MSTAPKFDSEIAHRAVVRRNLEELLESLSGHKGPAIAETMNVALGVLRENVHNALAQLDAKEKTLDEIEYLLAVANKSDTWVVAGCGTETWTRARSGEYFLYVFNPATGEHGWLTRGDIVLEECPY